MWKEEKLHKSDRLNVGKVGRGAGRGGKVWTGLLMKGYTQSLYLYILSTSR